MNDAIQFQYQPCTRKELNYWRHVIESIVLKFDEQQSPTAGRNQCVCSSHDTGSPMGCDLCQISQAHCAGTTCHCVGTACMLCPYVVPSCCALMLCMHVVPSCCALMLRMHIVPSCCALMLCPHVVSLCWHSEHEGTTWTQHKGTT